MEKEYEKKISEIEQRAAQRAKKKKKSRRILWPLLVALALVIVLLLSVCDIRFDFWPFSQKEESKDTVPVSLIAVYDGDTILVRMPDGTEETVRLLMIDAPESVHPDETKNTEEGRIASAFLKGFLQKDTRLYLEYEEGDNPRDVYGRLLAYVWLTDTTSVEPSYIKENMVNAILLSKGYATFHVYDNGNAINEKYKRILEKIR